MDARVTALIILAALSLATWGASHLYRAWVALRTTPAGFLETLRVADGCPTILGFTGEYCLPCRTQQHPALESLRAHWGDALHVVEVDALERADLARQYGVLTVPTTVVLDGARNVVAINYGVASAEKLHSQIAAHLHA